MLQSVPRSIKVHNRLKASRTETWNKQLRGTMGLTTGYRRILAVSPDALNACITCRANRDDLAAPGGVIYQDPLWRLEHLLEPVPFAGWLVLKPLRHVEAFAELTIAEATTFGPLVKRITEAMTLVLSPVKIYVALFAEAPNAAHIHFHLIPRYPGTPPDGVGPGAFKYLAEARQKGQNLVDRDDLNEIVERVRRQLSMSES